MSKKSAAFETRRPTRAKEEAARSRSTADRFVEGRAEKTPERQNLWIDPDLRLDVQLQARRNRESISAFATRAFRRELAEPSFVKKAD